MKRTIVILTAALCISSIGAVLCSCNEKSKTATVPLTSGFSATVTVTAGNKKSTAKLKADKDNNTEIEIISPENARNLKLLFSGDTVKLSYCGMEHTVSTDTLPENSPLKTVADALKFLSGNPEIKTEKGGNCFAVFSEGDKTYRIYMTENGLPLKITGGGTEILFEDLTLEN